MKIDGYFKGIKAANDAVKKLRSEGFSNSFADINDHPNNAYSQSGFVGSKEIPSLSKAVFGAGRNDMEVSSPLGAASPMANGMGGFEEIADVNYKVTVDTDEKNAENAKNIIDSMGGTMNSPNAKIPKGLENVNEGEFLIRKLNNK